MQYIFENIGYFCCVGEVSALNIDVFENSSFTCADRCDPLVIAHRVVTRVSVNSSQHYLQVPISS